MLAAFMVSLVFQGMGELRVPSAAIGTPLRSCASTRPVIASTVLAIVAAAIVLAFALGASS